MSTCSVNYRRPDRRGYRLAPVNRRCHRVSTFAVVRREYLEDDDRRESTATADLRFRCGSTWRSDFSRAVVLRGGCVDPPSAQWHLCSRMASIRSGSGNEDPVRAVAALAGNTLTCMSTTSASIGAPSLDGSSASVSGGGRPRVSLTESCQTEYNSRSRNRYRALEVVQRSALLGCTPERVQPSCVICPLSRFQSPPRSCIEERRSYGPPARLCGPSVFADPNASRSFDSASLPERYPCAYALCG